MSPLSLSYRGLIWREIAIYTKVRVLCVLYVYLSNFVEILSISPSTIALERTKDCFRKYLKF